MNETMKLMVYFLMSNGFKSTMPWLIIVWLSMKHLFKKADLYLVPGRANLNKHTNPCLCQTKTLVL